MTSEERVAVLDRAARALHDAGETALAAEVVALAHEHQASRRKPTDEVCAAPGCENPLDAYPVAGRHCSQACAATMDLPNLPIPQHPTNTTEKF